MSEITGQDIQKMVQHWLKTPVNGYLGSGYGQDLKRLLQTPQAQDLADEFLDKLKSDVAILLKLPIGDVNIYSVQTPPDRLDLAIEVSGTVVKISADEINAN